MHDFLGVVTWLLNYVLAIYSGGFRTIYLNCPPPEQFSFSKDPLVTCKLMLSLGMFCGLTC